MVGLELGSFWDNTSKNSTGIAEEARHYGLMVNY
jgi:hypothetical protein